MLASIYEFLQGACALENGFAEIALSHKAISDADPHSPDYQNEIVDEAVNQLSENRSVLLHTAVGPDDARIIPASIGSIRKDFTADRLGGFLGSTLRKIMDNTSVNRVCVAGGDTSSFAAKELGIGAMEVAALVDPGVPLCRAFVGANTSKSFEIAFKGGQMGGRDFFVRLHG